MKERKEKREIACERKREKQFNAINLVGFMLFKIFTTMSFNIVTQKLKTSKRSFLNSMFTLKWER